MNRVRVRLRVKVTLFRVTGYGLRVASYGLIVKG